MESQPEMRGVVPLLFAACLLALAAFINVAEWVTAIATSNFYPPNATYVVGDVHTWGWIQLVIGIIQYVAFFAIIAGRPWGRWLGIGIALLSVLAQLFFVNASPWWAVVVIGIDILVIYALTRYGVEPFAQAGETEGTAGDIGAVPTGKAGDN
jgi:hypothetical protein